MHLYVRVYAKEHLINVNPGSIWHYGYYRHVAN